MAEILTFFNAMERKLPVYGFANAKDDALDIQQMHLVFQVLKTLTEALHSNESNQIALIETNRVFRPCMSIIGIPLKDLVKKVSTDPQIVWNIIKLKVIWK